MSATNGVQRKATESRDIPSRRILIHDASQLPSDYSTTPGGTIFSTTPGGTRIIYDRGFLLQMRNSPIARTPPKNLPNIPGVTSPALPNHPKENGDVVREKKPEQKQVDAAPHCDDPQFEMDI